PDPTSGRDELALKRAALAERRTVQLGKQGENDRLLREAASRRQRMASIVLEERSWQNRVDGAQRQRTALAERHAALAAEIERLAELPAEIATQRAAVLETIATATLKRSAAGDALARGETALADAEKAVKLAEAALGAAREERVRCDAAVEQATQHREELARRVAER